MSEQKSRYELFLEEEERKAQPTKECSKCHKIKALSEYYNYAQSKDGKRPRCKECDNPPRKYKNEVDRFWKFYHSHTKQVGGCLEWTGYCVNTGYPVFHWGGKETTVGRIVYQLSCGDLADDMFVSPDCRNKKCVRQSHLRKITKEEKRMLQNNSAPFGPRNGHYIDGRSRAPLKGRAIKLKQESVLVIRQLSREGLSYSQIADRFAVCSNTVRAIVRRQTWKHVQ